MNELRAGLDAIKSGRSSRRMLHPPIEVSKAVNMMRAEADRLRSESSDNYVFQEKDILSNPFLLTPRKSDMLKRSQYIESSRPRPLFYNNKAPLPRHDEEQAYHERTNSYSVGKNMPVGVSWRYVDVFKDQSLMS